MRPLLPTSRSRGFTLIEMGIVLVVIGLVVSGGIATIGPFADARKSTATTDRMDQIEKALRLHVIRYGCLPCPADGTVNTSTGANPGMSVAGGAAVAIGTCAAAACLTASGVVPWREVGLSEDDITDGWGNRIRYAVAGSSVVAATCAAPTASLQLADGMRRTTGATGCYPTGNLTVNNLDIVAAAEPDVQNAAYVLVSNGSDKALALRAGTGGATGDLYGQAGGGGGQDENTNGDINFASGRLNGSSGATHFDDITRFTTAALVIQLCGPGTCGNPTTP